MEKKTNSSADKEDEDDEDREKVRSGRVSRPWPSFIIFICG
jgi:hypothetical protein